MGKVVKRRRNPSPNVFRSSHPDTVSKKSASQLLYALVGTASDKV